MIEKFMIVNVVAMAALDQVVDLELLHTIPKYIYGGHIAYYETEDIKKQNIIFWSGKLISVGTKTIEKASENYRIPQKH